MTGPSWWRGRSWRFWLSVLSPLLLMGGCGLFALHSRKMAADAERAADVFHRRLAGAQYDTIYDAAAPSFRAGVTRVDSARYFSAINVKMGACKPPDAPSYFTNTSTSGTHVQLRYRMQCANGLLRETMLYLITSGGPLLAGYDASSPALVIR